MKKYLLLILFMMFLSGCATIQKQQEITIFKSPEAKIQYYQEQITRYNYLIDQERRKLK